LEFNVEDKDLSDFLCKAAANAGVTPQLLAAVEIIHDVVFFPFAPEEPRYFLSNTAGSELFVTKISVA
jgi:hypothetical protein